MEERKKFTFNLITNIKDEKIDNNELLSIAIHRRVCDMLEHKSRKEILLEIKSEFRSELVRWFREEEIKEIW